MDYSRPELAERLAAEYVGGTLRGPARRRFENLLPAHAGLRQAVRLWQDRLMPLTVVVAPQTPSPAVWAGIQARLNPANATDSSATALGQPWWQRLALWRAVSAVTSLGALALALTLAYPPPVLPPIVVVLSATGDAAGPSAAGTAPASFVASISGDGRSMVTKPLTQVRVQPDRSLELWSLPPQGAPRSLGLISASQATVVQRSELLKGIDAFAVTLEPAGGSPHGAPTGPVVYAGKLRL